MAIDVVLILSLQQVVQKESVQTSASILTPTALLIEKRYSSNYFWTKSTLTCYFTARKIMGTEARPIDREILSQMVDASTTWADSLPSRSTSHIRKSYPDVPSIALVVRQLRFMRCFIAKVTSTKSSPILTATHSNAK